VTLFDSIQTQIESFQQGFSTVFPLDDILLFSPSELDVLINGTEEIWTEESNFLFLKTNKQPFIAIFFSSFLLFFFSSFLLTLVLRESIKADHGFTLDSPTIHNLIQIMIGFTPSQQKDFLKFVTGSPRLPIGGSFSFPFPFLFKLSTTKIINIIYYYL